MERLSNRNKSKGFILKDYLLGLLIVLMLFPMITNSFAVFNYIKFYDTDLEDYISLQKLKRELILAYDININNDSITYNKNDKNWTLKYADNKLYLGPGYQLFIDDINYLYFEIEDNILYINYIKNEKDHKYFIAKI